jgi:hypothetical protein
MRVLTILALALSLAGCNGDRLKQGMNGRQAQPQSKSNATPSPFASVTPLKNNRGRARSRFGCLMSKRCFCRCEINRSRDSGRVFVGRSSRF